ncbi:MAG: 50S ribosomal protein L6 [Bacilli bacterium]|nr:50S ribosomal protein L6 [Bacilli bacterium]
MSRIGKMPVEIPSDVKVSLEGNKIKISGPKGTLVQEFKPEIKVEIESNNILVSRIDDEKESRQLHGTTRALIANMVKGVEKGYSKSLVLKGTGYKAQMSGANVSLSVGYSHEFIIKPMPNTKIEVVAPTEIMVSGCDKQAVGEVAALIRKVREPEPYLGKGISYKGERIRHKEGKKAGK